MKITIKLCLLLMLIFFIAFISIAFIFLKSNFTNIYIFRLSNGTFVPDLLSGNNLILHTDSDGYSCWISIFNSSITGNKDISIKTSAKSRIAANGHGDIVSLGLASPNNRFALRVSNDGRLGIAGNCVNVDWTIENLTVDFTGNKSNTYFVKKKGNLTKIYLDNVLIGENKHIYDTLEAPIQIGCAMLPNGSTAAYFNGTINWVMISDK